MVFGLTKREWWLLGIGWSVNGAILSALYHDGFIFTCNIIGLAFDVYGFYYLSGSPE